MMFDRLVRHAGMAVPDGAARYLPDTQPGGTDPLLSDAFLRRAAGRAGLRGQKLDRLFGALRTIRSDRLLMALSTALRDDAHQAVIYQRACEFERPEPACLAGFAREAYALLFALSCLEKGLQALEKRGIPKEEYEEVCFRMADRQLNIYRETGSAVIADYPWDMNFYACGIFFHDRLYFVPYRWEGPVVYRREKDGRTLMLWPAGDRVRRDGQLDGVNGVFDPLAFTTALTEEAMSVTGCPVNPAGVISQGTVTLEKDAWRPALRPGEMTLAAHIPGGEGYTPERWKASMEKAKAFFDRYFPELGTKGFWSESWLYDPTLYRLLPMEGHILSVQRQFYNYPTREGDTMIKLEVFGTEEPDLDSLETTTSLQRKLRDSLKRGERYHTAGMMVLNEDLARFGQMPYQTAEGIREAREQLGVL